MGAAEQWDITAAERCGHCAAFSGAVAAVEGFAAEVEDYFFGMKVVEYEIGWIG